jgi:hypothetical protein
MITLSTYTTGHPLELLVLLEHQGSRELKVTQDQLERKDQLDLVLREQQDQQELKVILEQLVLKA